MKISVIVPVYKAEAYLHKCIESLLSQTFSDFEIILIDDGSPDKSGILCDNYARAHTHIKVIHQQNSGVSIARQRGLDASQGEYIIHTDPDDWVEPTMLEDLYNKAIEENADMVICDFYENTNSKQIYRKQQPTKLDNITVMAELYQQLHGSCCNKLIRRSCFNKYNIHFTPWLSFCEDLCLNTQLLKFNIKISYVPKAYYHYVTNINSNSIVKRIALDTLKYDLKVYDYLDNITVGFPAHSYFQKQFARTCTVRAFKSGLLTNKEFKQIYGKFADKLWNKKSFSPNNILLYLSCKGYYRLCYLINEKTCIGKL